jgi:hypothetical protein
MKSFKMALSCVCALACTTAWAFQFSPAPNAGPSFATLVHSVSQATQFAERLDRSGIDLEFSKLGYVTALMPTDASCDAPNALKGPDVGKADDRAFVLDHLARGQVAFYTPKYDGPVESMGYHPDMTNATAEGWMAREGQSLTLEMLSGKKVVINLENGAVHLLDGTRVQQSSSGGWGAILLIDSCNVL